MKQSVREDFVPVGIVIGPSIAALRAQRYLADATDASARSLERLSSGMRINRASDDAAGLSVAASLNLDQRVFAQGARNLSDAVSFLNVAQGALEELSTITQRQIELATQAANGSLSRTQRVALDREADALVAEYNRILDVTSFNELTIYRHDEATRDLLVQAGYGTSGVLTAGLGGELARTVGTGAFTSSYDVAGGGDVYGVDTGDVNGDGHLDALYAVSNGINSGGFVLRYGDGEGGFTSVLSGTTASGLPSAAADAELWDFDGDGDLDIAIGGFSPLGTVVLRRNLGDGTFSTNFTVTIGSGAVSGITAGDLDGDAIEDLVVALGMGATGRVAVLRGTADGGFAPASHFAGPVGTLYDPQLADLNGDGMLDLVAGAEFPGTAGVLIRLGNGDGSFAPPSSHALAGTVIRGVRLADLNGDGTVDIVTESSDTASMNVLLGNGNGTFRHAHEYVSPSGGGAASLELADVNGDGYLDAVSGVQDATAAIAVRLGSGDGTFGERTLTLLPGSLTLAIEAADFNGDGVDDLAAGTMGVGWFSLLLGDTDSSTRIAALDLSSQESARQALSGLDRQLSRVTSELALVASSQSRMDIALRNVEARRQGATEAKARIEDVDIAEESARAVRAQILQQVGAAVAAQANGASRIALVLLGA